MTSRKQRTGGAGLFVFTDQGADVEPGEIHDNPIRRPCPYCHARPGQRCTRPTRHGRMPNRVHHPAREARP